MWLTPSQLDEPSNDRMVISALRSSGTLAFSLPSLLEYLLSKIFIFAWIVPIDTTPLRQNLFPALLSMRY